MTLWRSFAGVIKVELTSAQPEKLLMKLSENGISLHAMKWISELTWQMEIYRAELKYVRKICEANGSKLQIKQRMGIFWTIKRLIKRPVLLGGLISSLFLALYLPSRVFFFQVEGNHTIPSKQILAAAEECGIAFGASRREVRSEKVKNQLLSAIPQLQWAGVNTSGCVATISVRERTEEEKIGTEKVVSSIGALRDGFILSATAVRGNLLVHPGETVRKGQILISGYTDCGISIRAEVADGEILAQTERTLESVTPARWPVHLPQKTIMKKYSLLIGKKRINLWKDSGISSMSCGRMYEENFIVLPGGFSLPIALCTETFHPYDVIIKSVPVQELTSRLSTFSEDYVIRKMVAGQIEHKMETTILSDGIVGLKAQYICREMIGTVQQEQIGEYTWEKQWKES